MRCEQVRKLVFTEPLNWRPFAHCCRLLRFRPERATQILDLVGAPAGRDASTLEKRAREKRDRKIPAALNELLARIPLSVLFLPQDRALALTPARVVYDEGLPRGER